MQPTHKIIHNEHTLTYEDGARGGMEGAMPPFFLVFGPFLKTISQMRPFWKDFKKWTLTSAPWTAAPSLHVMAPWIRAPR
jgi:hypothetical protein